MNKTEKNKYVMGMDEERAKIMTKLKVHYNEKSIKKVKENLIRDFFSLLDEIHRFKITNSAITYLLEQQRFEIRELRSKMKVYFSLEQEISARKNSLKSSADKSGTDGIGNIS